MKEYVIEKLSIVKESNYYLAFNIDPKINGQMILFEAAPESNENEIFIKDNS